MQLTCDSSSKMTGENQNHVQSSYVYHPLSPWKRLTGHLISFVVITISHDRIAIMSYHARAHVYALLFVYCVTTHRGINIYVSLCINLTNGSGRHTNSNTQALALIFEATNRTT